MIRTISAMYGRGAMWRRRWYASDPRRRRRLVRPVISVGNLRVGGSGKTPAVACIARILLDAGEHPAILTRGYARRTPSAGTTVVSDGRAILASADAAGDEPLLLARLLPGVPVLVSADRYLSGRLAEERFGATVHILDDGFQHHELARNADLLLTSEEDLSDGPLPAGHLREPLEAGAAADAVLVPAGYATAAERIGRALGVEPAFRVTHALGVPRAIAGDRETVVVPAGARVFAAAGIARPERFVSDLISVGWEVVGTMLFRDHHQFTNADVGRIAAAARAARTAIVLTTEKDAIRFEACDLAGLPIAAVPLVTSIEPAAAFRAWLLARLAA
ncbi:MAG TPA: tetraacyldisaccharide 4'-kinase [Vicinamibacterales bacterium]|nr:tetraacyldisaccharide 4'-kinase [Vicinamibacterales bacterium]